MNRLLTVVTAQRFGTPGIWQQHNLRMTLMKFYTPEFASNPTCARLLVVSTTPDQLLRLVYEQPHGVCARC
jgi:hypothetical protein